MISEEDQINLRMVDCTFFVDHVRAWLTRIENFDNIIFDDYFKDDDPRKEALKKTLTSAEEQLKELVTAHDACTEDIPRLFAAENLADAITHFVLETQEVMNRTECSDSWESFYVIMDAHANPLCPNCKERKGCFFRNNEGIRGNELCAHCFFEPESSPQGTQAAP